MIGIEMEEQMSENINMSMERRKKLNIDWNLFSSTLILEVFRNGKAYTSTAVAVSDRILITAAHSVADWESANIYIGGSYRDHDERIKVVSCIIHPEYDRSHSLYQNDLALILLEGNLPSFCKIEKIPLVNDVAAGELLERIGFGSRNERNKRTWTNPIFRARTDDRKNLILEDEHSVIGDSGGPIFKRTKKGVELIGIHSTLEGSSKTYIVNLAYYQDWIKGILTNLK